METEPAVKTPGWQSFRSIRGSTRASTSLGGLREVRQKRYGNTLLVFFE